jgi:LmbE family N-acetylglucosaminyl deacetylase
MERAILCEWWVCNMNPKEWFAGKRVMAVAAHHDDEVYAFGALLVTIFKVVSSLILVCMSDIREEKYGEICSILRAKAVTIDFPKYSSNESYFVEDIFSVSNEVQKLIRLENPDVIITHGNKVDGGHYHPYHIVVNFAVKHAAYGKIPIWVRCDKAPICVVRCGKKFRSLVDIYAMAKWQRVEIDSQGFDMLREII